MRLPETLEYDPKGHRMQLLAVAEPDKQVSQFEGSPLLAQGLSK